MENENNSHFLMLERTKNPLLVKSVLGKPRPVISKLPPTDFAYGKHSTSDQERVSDLISTWKSHRNSNQSPSSPNFKLFNSLKIKHHLSKASDLEEIRKKCTPQPSIKSLNKGFSLPNIRFGHTRKPSPSIENLLSFYYGREASEATLKKYEVLNKIKIEKSDKPAESCRMIPTNPDNFSVFKLKRFNEVKARTDCWRLKNLNN